MTSAVGLASFARRPDRRDCRELLQHWPRAQGQSLCARRHRRLLAHRRRSRCRWNPPRPCGGAGRGVRLALSERRDTSAAGERGAARRARPIDPGGRAPTL